MEMELSRRGFVAATAVTVACACCGMAEEALAREPAAPAFTGVLDAGPAKDIAEGITATYAKSHNIMIVRVGDTMHSTVATCTHRSCKLKANDVKPTGQEFRCSCHGSRFSLEGALLKGPAKVSLARYAVSIQDGKLLVDASKKFAQDQWSDPSTTAKLA